MQQYEYKQLRVTDLLLNSENPRFDPVKYQTEAIQAMIEDQGDKLIELAKHITAHGLSPMEIVLVQPLGTQWLVREGNRRVTALKLINEPELVPGTRVKMKNEFSVLCKEIESNTINNILCAIVSDEEVINEWIRLKHTGENGGIGTVGWDAQQTSRFAMQVSGKADPKSTLFESLRNNKAIPQKLRAKFTAIKKTNYDRLIGDPQVRELLGIEVKNGEYLLPQGVNAYFQIILSDLVGDFNVGRIYRKTDREAYLTEVIKRVELLDGNVPAIDINTEPDLITPSVLMGTPIEAPEIPQKKQPAAENGEKKKSYPINRKTLVPSQHRLAIDNARIVRIFSELKSLDCEQYRNAVSVLFRVFIELSCDCYISSKKLSGVNVDCKLTQKIESVANDIETRKMMNKNELRAVRQMASSQTQTQSVRTFHSYVHNKDVTPSASDLKIAWDDLWAFIEMMWR